MTVLVAMAAGAAGLLAGLAIMRLSVPLHLRPASVPALQDERLLELDRMKNDFLSSISHELRTPLMLISGYVDLVLEDKQRSLDPEQRDYLEVAARNGERLQHLVHDLLFVAQLDAGRVNLTLARTDIGAVLAERIESVRPAAEQKGVSLTCDLEPLDDAFADRTRIAQVADNLLTNALKFTPAGGGIRIGLHRLTDAGVVLEVSDTGIGMCEEDQEHAFERFYRAASCERNATPGTGLGLSIVKAITDAHGGKVAVTSALGEGTLVRVELPRLSTTPTQSVAA